MVLMLLRRGPHIRIGTLSRRMMASLVKVQVEQGTVVGKQRHLPSGARFDSFLGIPYARPPVADLRFKSPVPLERFDAAELDCTSHRDVSHQRDPFTQQVVGSENCLFLNVFVPRSRIEKHRSETKPLPVMVWIHGGGFWFGSGDSDYYFPAAFMEEEVIVVTLNYRLGALGFLCLPEADIWGNAGLKDQRLALEWVKQNISRFDGDPGNVTIFGESAGAASVHLHTCASHANRLFHKAIMQSGTANMEWVFQAQPEYKAQRLAHLLGCKSSPDNARELLKFLQSKDVTPLSILANTLPVLTADERRRGLPLAFKPVIEDAASPDSFIDAPILEILERKDTLTIPTIMGYNSAEGMAMVVNAARRLQECDRDLSRFVPRNIPLAPEDSAVLDIAQQMRNFYLGGRQLTPQLLDELTALLSDYHFTIDMQRAAELQASQQPRAPLYFYRFDYVGGRNMYKRIFQLEHLAGASHGDELFYLFQMDDGNDEAANAEDTLTTKRLCYMWANFARYGQPTPTPNKQTSNATDFEWSRVQSPSADDAFTLDYLSIGRQCEMRKNPEKERVDFWRRVYKQYKPIDYSRLSAKL